MNFLKKYQVYIIVIIILILFYFLVIKPKLKSMDLNIFNPNKNPDDDDYNPQGIRAIDKRASFPLKSGSKGREVLLLQAALNLYHDAGLTLDGIFGQKTGKAVSSRFDKVNFITKKTYDAYVDKYYNDIKAYLKANNINI